MARMCMPLLWRAITRAELAGTSQKHVRIYERPFSRFVRRLIISTAIIGDVDTCLRKLHRIADLGVDRLLCLMQLGHLPHGEVMRSIRTTGEALIPALGDPT